MTKRQILSDYIKKQGRKLQFNIGDIDIKSQLGEGGNGLVYEGLNNNQSIAIKFLVTESTGSELEEKNTRFLAEYENLISLQGSEYIVKNIHYELLTISYKEGEDEKKLEIPTIIMDKYNSSLKSIKDNVKKEDFLKLFNFLLDSVEYIHQNNIIHRDLKPQNILVDNNNKPVLADFGIAKYNDDFPVTPITRNNSRLSNREFSAPEQERPGTEAHPTMDIYALGQILQWYITGKTHKGTNRDRISNYDNIDYLYDEIVEKCLSQEPRMRFQSIGKIREYIEKKNDQNNSAMALKNVFNEIIYINFPNSKFTDKIDEIDQLLNDLKSREDTFGKYLWWTDGCRNTYFKLTQKGEGIWKFDNQQFHIDKIWVNKDYDSRINDFILIHFLADNPVIINGNPEYYYCQYEEHYISYNEKDSGYAKINGQRIKLPYGSVEEVQLQENEGYMFVGLAFNCVLQKTNDNIIDDFIKDIKNNPSNIEVKLPTFIKDIRSRYEYVDSKHHFDNETNVHKSRFV